MNAVVLVLDDPGPREAEVVAVRVSRLRRSDSSSDSSLVIEAVVVAVGPLRRFFRGWQESKSQARAFQTLEDGKNSKCVGRRQDRKSLS